MATPHFTPRLLPHVSNHLRGAMAALFGRDARPDVHRDVHLRCGRALACGPASCDGHLPRKVSRNAPGKANRLHQTPKVLPVGEVVVTDDFDAKLVWRARGDEVANGLAGDVADGVLASVV